jgi:protocatechuate 3,4-dioxygenase, beta subunit
MSLILTPEIGRRRFILGGVAAGLASAGGLALPSRAGAQQRVPTPAQTEGPFYPTQFPSDTDNDLVVVRGVAARAQGIVTHIRGRVLAADGRPIAGAQVEIWQCDAGGRYLHPGSEGRRPRDTAFQGFGRAVSDADGSYMFRTIRPVAYAGRTPHIHFAVAAGGARLVTQMYVAGEPLNARDGLYASLRDRRQRDAVTVRLVPANGIEAGALAGAFDIVMRG